MHKLARAALIAAVSVAGTATAGADEPPPHAVGGITVSGSADAPLGAALRKAAESGIVVGGARSVPSGEVARILGAVPDLATCGQAACLSRFAAATGAGRVVAVDVDAKGELYVLTVTVADSSGRAVRRRQDSCVACAIPDVQEKVTTLVKDAIAADKDDNVPTQVRSRPTGAGLTIDGAARGTTPWRGELVAGSHRMVATADDGRAIAEDVFVAAGPDAEVELTFPSAGGRRRWGPLRWAAAGTGGAMVLTGIVLLSMDGDGTCSQASCPEEYETTAYGTTFLVVGVAAGAAAGWMIWQDRKTERASLAIVPTGGGVAAGLSGRF